MGRAARAGLTLVELLAAITITLLLILAMAKAFELVGDRVKVGRANIELAQKLRVVSTQLQDSIDGVSVPVRPWPRPGSGLGYFEYGEGPIHDSSSLLSLAVDPDAPDTFIGDFDDYVAMTVRSVNEPFTGRIREEVVDPINGVAGNYRVVQSPLAEVIWWLQLEDADADGMWDSGETFTLRRRVLLIVPDLNNNGGFLTNAATSGGVPELQPFLNDNDLSVHINGAGQVVANSLSDLTRRENRVAHVPGAGNFPNLFDRVRLPFQNGIHQGEDILLAHVVGFDIRAFDPTAPIRTDASQIESLVPGDLGFAAAPATVIGLGAYVDLAYSANLGLGVTSQFSARPVRPPGAVAHPLQGFPTYDTWSLDYEYDGLNQDGGLVDQGTNGVDDDGVLGVDNSFERETSPPYQVPLRGLRITIRVLDRDTRQVRQMTVVSDFTPE